MAVAGATGWTVGVVAAGLAARRTGAGGGDATVPVGAAAAIVGDGRRESRGKESHPLKCEAMDGTRSQVLALRHRWVSR